MKIEHLCRMLIALMALGLVACPETPPSTENNQADMAPDLPPDIPPDLGPPTCQETSECTGDYAGWQCVGGVCTDCAPGDLDCACRLNGTCQENLLCDRDVCVPCVDDVEGCSCGGDGACRQGLSCVDDLCVAETCTPGALECPCDDQDGCTDVDAYCDGMGVCQVCSSDVVGCPCEADGTCAGTNYCDDADTCQTCPDERKPVGCACQDPLDCGDGLTCDEDDGTCRERRTCAELCVPNQECDASGAGDPVCVVETCVDGFVWDMATGMCVEIPSENCDGRDGNVDKTPECEGLGKACAEVGADMAVCVDTCVTLQDTCAMQNKLCMPAALQGQDASCDLCVLGYLDDGAGNCVLDPGANCAPLGAPGSIADACRANNQECEVVMGGARCGACLQGFIFDPTANACVEQATCGGAFCAPDEYCSYPAVGPPVCAQAQCGPDETYDANARACISCAGIMCDAQGVYPEAVNGVCACASEVFCSYEYDGASARCQVSQCGAGEARTPGGQCITCNRQCGVNPGERARLWPETTNDGSCICETQEGYYMEAGAAASAKQCDIDKDGWINTEAKENFDAASNIPVGPDRTDDALLANFRCEIRRVDTFVLRNEWGQERHVSQCGDEMIDYAPGAASGCTHPDGLRSLVLFEANALDDPVALVNEAATLPAIGTRRPAPAELNGLTKMCGSVTGDYNQNGAQDVLEEHAIGRTRLAPGIVFTGTSANEQFAFHSLSYFTELHTGYYVPPANASNVGSYVIAERSRCGPGFTLGYVNGSSGYWQSCTRGRISDYDFAGSQVGHDFAHFACSGVASGSCSLPEPPVVAGIDADGDRIEDHGLCDQTGALPNEPWRGMTHHSQFQCVVLKTVAGPGKEQLPLARVYQSGETDPQPFEFNECALTDCSSGMMNCTESTSQGATQPLSPEFSCVGRERPALSNDQVGWVSVRYVGGAKTTSLSRPYVRGCIDESEGIDGESWSALCPGYLLDNEINDDTCATANNGVCEDAGEGSTAATCVFGSDITDCGQRFKDNSAAVLTAGNRGNSGKLICACNEFYGGSDCRVSCYDPGGASQYLHVGGLDRGYNVEQREEFACDDSDFFCLRHAPDPADGFPEGGRRGYWLCGETTQSSTRDASGADVASLTGTSPAATTYEVRGEIPATPVLRQTLTGSGVVNGQSRTYSLE